LNLYFGIRFQSFAFSNSTTCTATPRYPAWLEGTWNANAGFEGYAFPSKNLNAKLLVKEPTVPGFQKLSMVYIPDVGMTDVRYAVRFVRGGGGAGTGPVYEDRAFNLRAVVNAYLGKEAVAADGVEYDRAADPNRTTVRLAQGASPNAERIELFCNARESETRASDGTFFASEAMRQVTLGYGREYGQARVVNTDYQHVWTYTPLYDDEDGGAGAGGAGGPGADAEGVSGSESVSGGEGEGEGGGSAARQPRRVRVTLSTAGYIQANDALRLTAAPQVGGGAPVPQMGFAGTAAFEPAVLYSHSITLERV
jgi:hypothetical protein